MAWRVMTEKKHSTRLIHEHPVGVKCRVTRGFFSSHAADLGVLVSGVVVADHVQPGARVGGGDLLQEAQELLVPVLRVAGVGDLPGRGASRAANRRWSRAGRSRGSAARGCPSASAGSAGCAPAPGTGTSRPRRPRRRSRAGAGTGRRRRDLCFQLRVGGELEPLGAVRLQAEPPPQPGDRVVADPDASGPAQPVRQPPARPVRHAQRPQRLRRRRHRRRPDLRTSPPRSAPSSARPAAARPPARPAVLGVLPPPLDHRRLGAAHPLSDLRPVSPSAASSTIRARSATRAAAAAVPGPPLQLHPVSIGHRQNAHAIGHAPLFPRKLKGTRSSNPLTIFNGGGYGLWRWLAVRGMPVS